MQTLANFFHLAISASKMRKEITTANFATTMIVLTNVDTWTPSWGGLYLRDKRLRATMFLNSPSSACGGTHLSKKHWR